MTQVLGLSNDDVKTIGAGATTVGVLLALFAPPLRRWWRRPMLSLEYQGEPAEPHWDHVRVHDEAFFLRLRVQNARGCDAAEEAQVVIASFRAAPLGLEGRALEWSGQRPRYGTPVTTIRLPPGLQRHVDIVQITRRPTNLAALYDDPCEDIASVDPARALEARLCVYPKPWGASHLLPRGTHDVVVMLVAKNADACSYRFTIVYDGQLSARLLSAPRREQRRSLKARARAAAKWALGDLRI